MIPRGCAPCPPVYPRDRRRATFGREELGIVFAKIGGVERRLEEVEDSWINQQINRRRASREAVCVMVRIDAATAKVTLATPACGGAGGGRPATAEERRIIDLWRRHRLDTHDFTGGKLIAFLR